jgi:sortase A
MKGPVRELKTRPPTWGPCFAGKSPGSGAISRILTPIANASHSWRCHGRANSLLRLGQYLCLLLACGCLGIVALDYARAGIFQAYQSWRFDRIMGNQPPPRKSSGMAWLSHALSTLMGGTVARPSRDTFQSNSPALAGRGSVPAIHAIPMGFLVGRMEIPRIGISVMVLEGDGDDVLGKAVGHVPTTAFPGGAGNVVIAGHRDTFFRPLRKIRKDDEIAFTTTQGIIYNYQVWSIAKVEPGDLQVLKASSHPTLTLITCHPFDYIGPAPKRFIVQARETQSARVGEPDQSLANTRPTPDSNSGVLSASSARIKEAHHNSSRSP